tara:strand:+ start:244 stop:2682 length:2439 start_codon:yes stop_codon:yes gene_type:complete
MTQITTKNSSTGAAVPATGDLVKGELAVNVADKKLYTKDAGGAIVELGINPTTIDINAGTIDGTTIGATTPAAISGTTGTFTGEITANGGIALDDSDKATFGASDDLQIYHDGANSYVNDQGTGDLILRGSPSIKLQSGSGAVEFLSTNSGTGALTLAPTNFTGAIDVTGTASADQLNSNNGKLFLDDNGSHNGVINAPASLYVNFDSDNTSASEKIVFGYDRDGTSGGTSVMEISSTGIDVTGNLQATGYLAVDGASGNTGAGTDRWIGGDGTAGTWFYNVPTGSNHYFAVNNANKLAITSTGIDVSGTATADGFQTDTANTNYNLIARDSANVSTYIQNGGTGDVLHVSSGNMAAGQGDLHLKVTNNGDVSFYNSGGSATAKFFWDASAESLGIGTDSPSSELTIGADTPQIDLLKASSADVLANIRAETDAGSGGKLVFQTKRNGNTAIDRMTIDDDGNVGIGCSPVPSGFDRVLHLHGTNHSIIKLTGSTYGTGENDGSYIGMSYGGLEIDNRRSTYTRFSVGGTERMRIDSSGDVLMGTTDTTLWSNSGSGEGIALMSGSYGGYLVAARDDGTVFEANRLNSDGTVISLRKDGTAVGSIGTSTGGLYIADAGVGFRFDSGGTDDIIPCNQTGGAADASINLGSSGARFKDLYLTGHANFGTAYASTGIYLGAYASANLLDDYEEGTWTPTLNMTSGSVSYHSRVGQYTKIGNQVTLTGWIYINGVSSPSGALNITVPFVASSANTRPSTMIISNNTTGVTGNVGMWIDPNTTNMYLQIVNNASLASLDGSNMTTNTELYVTITYITA